MLFRIFDEMVEISETGKLVYRFLFGTWTRTTMSFGCAESIVKFTWRNEKAEKVHFQWIFPDLLSHFNMNKEYVFFLTLKCPQRQHFSQENYFLSDAWNMKLLQYIELKSSYMTICLLVFTQDHGRTQGSRIFIFIIQAWRILVLNRL